MTNFTNLKIEVNEEQPLDEIVKELERLGYEKDNILNDCHCYVYTFDDDTYFVYMGNGWNENLTTLAELKEMDNG